MWSIVSTLCGGACSCSCLGLRRVVGGVGLFCKDGKGMVVWKGATLSVGSARICHVLGYWFYDMVICQWF